ncbi:HAMP domain-containing sensor histidine kinase [Clostridium sp. DSM 8431]|uniref:sensor histidine kinase n=1 Tax=Clostridium sp. DSM 8431 TaxID=1761781 RepID=UPI001FA829F7|nr:HAMP domain-containing sensor histidine kinase [Clostridium sp. DSM 8431]
MKNKIKYYLKNVWLIEIVIVLFIIGYFGMEIFKGFSPNSYSRAISAVEAVLNPKDYYEESLQSDSHELMQMVYNETDSFRFLMFGDSNVKTILQKNFLYKTYEKRGYEIKDNVFFIIRNKYTNEVYTNDPNQYFQLANAEYSKDNILSYLDEKYNGKELYLYYDNENKFNNLVDNEEVTADNDVISNFEEYYYTSVDTYEQTSDKRVFEYLSILAIIGMFLLIKIVLYFIFSNNKKIRGNFILNSIYVLKYGFSFKQTRRTLIVTIICSILFFILYLYLLAIGGYESNLLVTFFRLYPFKGSFLLMILPTIGIMYSIKKTIEICMVNESLEKINNGDLNYHIVEQGSPEILELIENINKIQTGYEIAVEDTLRNEKLKTELISNVSHDLRTPLTSIINYVNILKSPEITEDERNDYLKIVDKKAKKLKVLIDDLFEMSKINSGKIKLNRDRIDIMSLIHQVVGEYAYLYEDKNIEFKISSESEEIYMDLDGNMMSRVIENIVINALKYSLENTRVYIDVRESQDNVEISCKNIANYEMNFNNDEIIERFARGDRSRNSKVEGSGLGLAITKSIIELHNGTINILKEGDMFKIFIHLPKKVEENS